MNFGRVLNFLGIYGLYEWLLDRQVRKGPMPEHIAVMMDGNRRWAKSNSLTIEDGYVMGGKKARQFLEWCLELDIKSVTLYTFSAENFKRDPSEVQAFMNLLASELKSVLTDSDIHKYEVHIKAIGELEKLPENVKELINRLEKATEHYNRHYVSLALAYGAQFEILNAIRRISEKVMSNEIEIDQIDEKMIGDHMYTSHLPKSDVDLLIRTSGEQRLSNFLLWQSVGSYPFFVDIYWPEFRRIDLLRAIRDYQKRLHSETNEFN